MRPSITSCRRLLRSQVHLPARKGIVSRPWSFHILQTRLASHTTSSPALDPSTFNARTDDTFEPNLATTSSTYSSPQSRYDFLSASLITNPTFLALDDLLFLLSAAQLGPLTPDAVATLYKTLLSIPAKRFVFSTLHFNQLLSHLLLPYEDNFDLAVPVKVQRQVDQYTSDLRELGLSPDGTTHAFLMLSRKDHHERVLSTYAAIPNHLKKQLPIVAFNLLLHLALSSADKPITKSGLWEIYTSIQKSHAQPNILTFELLLTAVGPRLKDGKAFRRIMLRLGISDLEWRRQSFAAALQATAECGDEKGLNRIMYKLRTAKIPVDRTILNGILRFWINGLRPRAAIRQYHRLTKQFPSTLLPTSSETYILLLESCALIPSCATPGDETNARTEAQENVAIIREEMVRSLDTISVQTFEYLAKCYIRLDDPRNVLLTFEYVKKLEMGGNPYVPGALMLEAVAEAHGRIGDLNAIREFLDEDVFVTETLVAHYGADQKASDIATVEPFEGTYEALLSGWLESGNEPTELVDLLTEMRKTEKKRMSKVIEDRMAR